MKKREIPVLNYGDAWQILARDRHEDNVVDDASEEVMLRIEATMSRLKVMGDDERRDIWIRARRRSGDFEWLRLMTARYKDFHYLILSDAEFRFATLKNREAVSSTGKEYPMDFTAPLLALEEHVRAVVDWICEAPKEYNSYVNRYLPYNKRSGDIPRKVLYEIAPEWNYVKDPERLIEGLEKVKSATPTEFEARTLRTYITVWCAAFRVLAKVRIEDDGDEHDRRVLRDCGTLSDIELFRRYDSKGEEIEGLDLDSPEDYMKWYEGNSSFHCMDVSYARIHLNFASADYGKTGPCHFCIHFGVFGYFEEVAEIAVALYDQGIVIDLYEVDGILKTLRQEDMVGFRPWPDKYKDRDGVASQVRLPHIGEVTREVYWKIIHATSWRREEEVLPEEQVQV